MLASGLGAVKTDPSQFELVIMNLAVNARDAMPDGGRLIIETRNTQVGHDEDERLAPGSYVVLSVSDTGHGMDAETAAHIFEPFFTTKERGKGTGLGLSTAYGIVEQCGGTILVESAPKRGSVFRVYLPVSEAAGSQRDDEVNQPSMETRSGTIMVVEDEAPLRRLVCTILSGAGYKIAEAANGHEALSLAMQYRERIDVLLTDVVMPGMNGPELVEKLRRSRPDLTVIFMSGYDQDLLEKRVPDKAVFLPKPFTPEILLLRMAEVMGQSGSRLSKAG